MKSIPVSVNEHTWVRRFPLEHFFEENLVQDKIVEHKLCSPKKARTLKRQKKENDERDVCLRSTAILSMKQTRSGRIVVPKKFDDQIVGDVTFEHVEEVIDKNQPKNSSSPPNETKTSPEKGELQIVKFRLSGLTFCSPFFEHDSQLNIFTVPKLKFFPFLLEMKFKLVFSWL